MSFKVPVHELIKQPGAMKELNLSESLGADLGTEIAALKAGTELEIELRLESVHEGILATGELQTELWAACSRCLEDLNLDLEVDFQELFAYSSTSDDEFLVDGDYIDLEQIVIDSVVLNLPFQPLCSADCLGLCAECGMRLSEDPGHQHESAVDPRFSALEGFVSKEE